MKRKRTPAAIPVVDAPVELGLTTQQVQQRIEGGWDNRVTDIRRSEKAIILRYCFTYFNLVFLVMALILVLARSSVTNFGFLGVVFFNTAIGIVQEIRAKRAVDKLTLVAEQTLKTVRDGVVVQVRDRMLVRDDIVHFAPGDQICADGVVRSGELQVDESLVTGEADAIGKKQGDRLLSGSFVVAGSGYVQLTKVGDEGYAARLAAEAKRNSHATKSGMMKALDVLVRFLSIVLVPLGILYFFGEYSGGDGAKAATQTVAALVSLIPQGLYLLTSVAMAASAIQLSRRKVLVQDMNCIETLARVDVLCVDKTGTITQPGLEVERLIPLAECTEERASQVLGALFAQQGEENDTAAALSGVYANTENWKCLHCVPFTSAQKWSGAVFEDKGTFLAGAPEFVLGSRYTEVAQQVQEWTLRGCRVLVVAAYGETLQPGSVTESAVEPLALVVLSGMVRPEAAETFRYFARQGVTVKVISGDNPLAVSQIAGRAGIPGAGDYVDCTGLDDPTALEEAARRYTVFGRVTPEQKRDLIRALQAQKHTVAMTGDGVNDVLAMRQADCAVAMASGAQAAGQVAQLVLTESDFSAMPHIVDEGRRVINNIQRATALFLVKNVFTMLLVLTSLATSLAYVFEPVNLTLVTALTVGVPSFFFAMEPNYARVRGTFLVGALRRALPAGIAAFGAVVATQLIAPRLGVEGMGVSTACSAVLAAIGILVLVWVSRPMTVLRGVVLGTMTTALVGAFLLPVDLFKLDLYRGRTPLLAVLMMALAVVTALLLRLVMEGVLRLWNRRTGKTDPCNSMEF